MKKYLLGSLMLLFAVMFSDKATACTANIAFLANPGCPGDSIVIMASPVGQPNYQWYVNGNPISFTGAYYYGSISTPGTYIYTVEITDGSNCTVMSNPLTVVISTPPTVSASSNGPVCAGSTLQLTGAVSNATSYSWAGPNSYTSSTLSPSISNMQSVNAGVYTLTATNGSCNVSAGTNVVVNNNTPTVTLSSSGTNSCSGDSFFVWSSITGLTGVTYSWTGPNSFTSTSSYFDIQNTTTANSGTYTLTVSGTGCGGPVTLTSSITMTVNTTPVITVANNGPLCAGSNLQLTGTVSVGTYNWTGPNSFTSTSLTPTINNVQSVNAGNYVLHANNGGCLATGTTNVVVMSNNPQVYASADTILCAGETLTLYASIYNLTSPTYSWSGPNSFTSTSSQATIPSVTTANAGMYTLTVTGTSCGGTVTLTNTVTIAISVCDSVWPGDANSDLIANNQDVLRIGLLYGETGSNRTGASMAWVGQPCSDWATVFSGVNAKHADCNGNGFVDSSDVMAVTLNYGQTHLKGEHQPQAKSSGLPDLYFDMTGIVLGAGATVTIPIKLGTTTTVMTPMYGIATEVKISGITLTSPMTINASTSWIGNSSNTINFTEAVSNNQTDWTYVRKDHSNMNGDGTIGSVTFTVPTGSEYQSVVLYFDNVTIVDNNGIPVTAYNVIDGGGMVFPLSANTASSLINSASIVPNPSDAHASLQLSLVQASKVTVVVTDITGRNIWTAQKDATAGTQNIELPSAQLAPGMYQVQVRDEKGSVAQSLKWIKK